jgi:hypothetical protein
MLPIILIFPDQQPDYFLPWMIYLSRFFRAISLTVPYHQPDDDHSRHDAERGRGSILQGTLCLQRPSGRITRGCHKGRGATTSAEADIQQNASCVRAARGLGSGFPG